MSNRDHVSVVLPYYNRVDCLQEAASSVLDQTHRNLTLWLVNDGSTDGSPAIARSIADDRVKHIDLPVNAGPSAARNAGLEVAGQLVAFMDSDDRWMPSKLELQLRSLRSEQSRNPLVGVIGGGWRVDGQSATKTFLPGPFERCDVLSKGVAGIGTPLLLVDREVIADARFDPSMPALVDRDYVIACLAGDTQLVVVPDVLAVVRRGRSDHVANPQRAAAAWERLLDKYGHELQGQPEIWSHHKYRTAREHLVYGNVGAALPHVVDALRYYRSRRLLHLAAGALGRRRGLAVAQRLAPL